VLCYPFVSEAREALAVKRRKFISLLGGVAAAHRLTTGLWSGLSLSAGLALVEAWFGITIAYYSDWPVSFCISVLSALVYFVALALPQLLGSIPKQQIS
jgi:ABC-type Mn2+/Zn2+ transport system permease subunit